MFDEAGTRLPKPPKDPLMSGPGAGQRLPGGPPPTHPDQGPPAWAQAGGRPEPESEPPGGGPPPWASSVQPPHMAPTGPPDWAAASGPPNVLPPGLIGQEFMPPPAFQPGGGTPTLPAAGSPGALDAMGWLRRLFAGGA